MGVVLQRSAPPRRTVVIRFLLMIVVYRCMTHPTRTRSQDDKFEHSKIGTIGVDFRFRTINVDGATIKLQIVRHVKIAVRFFSWRVLAFQDASICMSRLDAAHPFLKTRLIHGSCVFVVLVIDSMCEGGFGWWYDGLFCNISVGYCWTRTISHDSLSILPWSRWCHSGV